MYSNSKKAFLLALGFLSLVLGIVGIFLPLVPTTPFILLAAWCFMKSSTRYHDWILAHKQFGPMIQAWRKNRAISLKAKSVALSALAISFIIVWNRPEIGNLRYAIGLFSESSRSPRHH